MVRHNDIFTAANPACRLSSHELDEMMMKGIRCQDLLSMMCTESDEIQGRIIRAEDGLQARRAVGVFLVHTKKQT